jgi:major intracellular serine protease
MFQTMQIAPDLIQGPEFSATEFHALAPSERPWTLPQKIWDEIHKKRGLRGQDCCVAVIDDGCELSHENFKDENGESRIIYANSHVRGESPSTGGTHGTHVTGTAAGTFTGVAPSARIVVLKGLNSRGSGSSGDLTNCGLEINEMVASGKISQKIVECNMSYGGGYYQPQEDQLEQAERLGIGNNVAAGNEGNDGARPTCGHPGTTNFGTTVGSIDANGNISRFSSQCKQIDICAGGGGILSSTVNGRYGLMSGTSMATPFITGAKAILRQAMLRSGRPVISSGAEWNEFFRANALDRGSNGHDWKFGFGVLDFATLLTWFAEGELTWI